MGSYGLSAWIYDRAGRGEESASSVSVGQGGEPVPGLGHIQARPPSHSGEGPAHSLNRAADPAGRDHGQNPFGAGQRGRAEQRTDFSSEASAGDQDETLDPLREQV